MTASLKAGQRQQRGKCDLSANKLEYKTIYFQRTDVEGR